mmetsp:Transcript_45320/g.94325  ORF Transcript_45320/g.94325 Transcript_45320/m.94325 type:complete len:228 (+) Transcript_45320:985-1668(+)
MRRIRRYVRLHQGHARNHRLHRHGSRTRRGLDRDRVAQRSSKIYQQQRGCRTRWYHGRRRKRCASRNTRGKLCRCQPFEPGEFLVRLGSPRNARVDCPDAFFVLSWCWYLRWYIHFNFSCCFVFLGRSRDLADYRYDVHLRQERSYLHRGSRLPILAEGLPQGRLLRRIHYSVRGRIRLRSRRWRTPRKGPRRDRRFGDRRLRPHLDLRNRHRKTHRPGGLRPLAKA